MSVFSSRFSYYNCRNKKKQRDPKVKLYHVFKSYAEPNGELDKEKLKDAFQHLDAAMPYRQAEEALRVVGKSYYINIHNDYERDTLIDYAYNKGYGSSI